MQKAKHFTFHEAAEPGCTAVTKFGGNPVWLTGPEWPRNAEMGEPLLLAGQIALDPDIFGELHGQLAYLFVAWPDALTARVGFHWHENAVIIQPGPSTDRPSLPLAEGPSICRVEQGHNA